MKLDTQMQLGRNLRTLRTSNGLSQTELADLLGITRALYAGYELGNRTPDAEILLMISNRFGITINSLFEKDHSRFLNLIADCERYDDELMKLVLQYNDLSSFAKGMLIERAVGLAEWDRIIESNRQALSARKSQSV